MGDVIPIYRGSCPSCGGDISSVEVEINGMCDRCLNGGESPLTILKEFLAGSEGDFAEFFERLTGFRPWGGQKYWLKRLLRGENAVLIAPTGLGKSTLLIVYAIYSAIRGKKVVYVTPTKSLLDQVYEKVVGYLNNINVAPDLALRYSSSYSKKRRLAALESIQKCDYKLLIITSNFLTRCGELLINCRPDIIIIDDVDSLLRSKRGVLNLIKVLGYSQRAVELVKRRANLLWRILRERSSGKNCDDLIREYVDVDRQLEVEISSCRSAQVVVASATARSRGQVARLLKDLIGVDVSGISIYGRNVTDCYSFTDNNPLEISRQISSIIKRLGAGCIIYISPHHPLKEVYQRAVESILVDLEASGLRVALASPRTVAEFMRGEIDVIVGHSTYYGVTVRGLDSPQHIRYAIFLGTPLFALPLESFLARPSMLVRILFELSSKAGDANLRRAVMEIRKGVLKLSPSEKDIIRHCLLGRAPESSIELSPRLADLYKEIKASYYSALRTLKELLDREGVLNVGTMTLFRQGPKYSVLVPDAMTYIQASGRVSRLIGNKMTHGLSILVEFRGLSNLISGLERKLKTLDSSISIVPIELVSLEQERELIRRTREGFGSALSYRSILLVVESPTKAKTIARFFGRPTSRRVGEVNVYTIPAKIDGEVIEFNVVATRGHLYDLSTNSGGLYGVVIKESAVLPVYDTIKRCRICGHQFVDFESCPRCNSKIYFDAKYVISVLRKLASEVDEVYIATDPDIEGEKIAFDVYIAVRPFNSNVRRIKLHEISLSEFLRALRSGQSVDQNLVQAEIYRRILDRLLGFSLSEKLQWRYGLKFLGAGRVQTPVLGLIIERFKLYLDNKCKRVTIKTSNPVEITMSFTLDCAERGLLEALRNAKTVEVVKLFEEVVEVSPKPPYTTDELLADASRRGIPSEVAMRIAQELFESGLITYHRTDCTHVSSTGQLIAREYLSSKQLINYFKPGHWGVPGAHEAIRPVYSLDVDGLFQAIEEGVIPVVLPLTGMHFKLYDMIFRRFIASQMRPYKAVKARFRVFIDSSAVGEIDLIVDIVENGFNLVLPIKAFQLLRGVSRATLTVSSVEISDSSRVPLYSDGDIVTLMKRLGIGRPSTYVKILKSIRSHGYVISSKKRNKLVPTKRGIEVYNYLIENYPSLISVEVTRRMEAAIDSVASGATTSFNVIMDLISNLISYGVIDSEKLVLPPNFDSYIGFEPPTH